MNSERYSNKITLYGSAAEIAEAKRVLNDIKLSGNESDDRLLLQREVVDNVKVDILYDGNSVYSKTKLLKQFKTLLKLGMGSLSSDLYRFFINSCGSIALYNKAGWINEYPDLHALRQFFICNEFGQSVLQHQPSWATDRIEIVKEMMRMLNALSTKIEGEKDVDIAHRLDLIEQSVTCARQDKEFALKFLKEIGM